jgi:hypothetical protein
MGMRLSTPPSPIRMNMVPSEKVTLSKEGFDTPFRSPDREFCPTY